MDKEAGDAEESMESCRIFFTIKVGLVAQLTQLQSCTIQLS